MKLKRREVVVGKLVEGGVRKPTGGGGRVKHE
jgi:hypothetical protein